MVYSRVYCKKCILNLSGTVGSGKSTTAIYVAEFLRRMGLKVKIVNITGFHVFSYVFLYVLARLTYHGKDFRELIRKKIHPASLIKGYILDRMLGLLVMLEFVSIHLTFLFKIIIPLKLGYNVVIVDEGVVNVINNYIVVFHNTFYKKGRLTLILTILRLIESISRIATFTAFFLDCNNSVLVERWKLRGSPPQKQRPFTFSDYIQYLNRLRNTRNIIKQTLQTLNLEVKEIDTTSKDPLEVSKEILMEINLLE